MKKKILVVMLALMMVGSTAGLTACGGSKDGSSEDSVQETEETVQAADPMTDEEMENDDTDGCVEDSEDLLY